MKHLLRPLLGLVALACAASATLAQETEGGATPELGDCRENSAAKTRLAACTAIIDGAKVKGDALAYAYLQRGTAHAEGGELVQAIKDFDRAIKLAPKATDALYDRGAANAQLGKWQAALGDFDRLLKIAPKDADALYMRAWVHAQMGKDEAAISDLDTVLGLYPEDQAALFDRAGLLLRAGRADDAARDFGRVLELDPKAASAAFNRGRANYVLASYGLAAKDFKLTLSLAPGNPYAALRLHLAELRSGKGAAKALEAALSTIGKDEWPSQLLLVYLGKLKGEDVLPALADVPEADKARLVCEANYYLGALAEIEGHADVARTYFEAAVATDARTSVEFIDAKLALGAR